MAKKMETTIMRYIRATIRINSFIPSYGAETFGPCFHSLMSSVCAESSSKPVDSPVPVLFWHGALLQRLPKLNHFNEPTSLWLELY